MKFEHQPVLLSEAVEALNIQPNKSYADGTLGGGGHALEILKRNGPKGLFVGIDRDPAAIFYTRKKLEQYQDRCIFAQENYRNINKVLDDHGISKLDGILLDLGLSSFQLADETRGFSFAGSQELDMRMGSETELTAAQILNTYSQDELQEVFSKYGEERYSKSIARKIVEYRQLKKFKTTDQLTRLIEEFYETKSYKARPKKIHPATKVYQALRIEVNDELGGLQEFLEKSLNYLNVDGRLVIITFHSLEDKIVKEFFRGGSVRQKVNKYAKEIEPDRGVITIITKKPITPSEEEVAQNPRSRSAKLRIAQKN